MSSNCYYCTSLLTFPGVVKKLVLGYLDPSHRAKYSMRSHGAWSRSRTGNSRMHSIQCYSASELTAEAAKQIFKRHQVLHIRFGKDKLSAQGVSILRSIMLEFPHVVRSSWTAENQGDYSAQNLLPEHVLGSKQLPLDRWYVSFIAQSESLLKQKLVRELPLISPAVVCGKGFLSSIWSDSELQHTDPVWMFCGMNQPHGRKRRRRGCSEPLRGRVEHTDSVSHSGTWHYQVCGTKTWYIRPMTTSAEWTELTDDGMPPMIEKWRRWIPSVRNAAYSGASQRCKHFDDALHRVRIDVCEGDVLIVNTRLWWHETAVPDTTSFSDGVCFSYARDFYFAEHIARQQQCTTESGMGTEMCNVDGIYASRDMQPGDIVFTEAELPDCELPR